MKRLFFLPLFLCWTVAFGQVLTAEDSLTAGVLRRPGQQTVLSGYGEAQATYDAANKTASASLSRVVLFVGHRFNRRIQLFTELELENAKVTGGFSGEVAMEQAFIKFGLSNDAYLVAGLFIPRIGIINENHLPTTFHGTTRPELEQQLIPATWRELGVGLYGQVRRVPGLNYSIGLVNGLNGSQLIGGQGLGPAKYEGSNASMRNIALTGALLQYAGNWRLQLSGYYGGATGVNNRTADSLGLSTGPFGTPVALVEANAIYRGPKGFECRALASRIALPDAAALNSAYARNTPAQMQGAYVEAGYDVLARHPEKNRKLIAWARAEYLDLNSRLPENGIANGASKKTYVRTGITYQPTPGVVVKAEYRHQSTGAYNPDLILNPIPTAPAYLRQRDFVSIGLGYSF